MRIGRLIFCTIFILSLIPSLSEKVSGSAYITVASTTSTANSGLFDYLLPLFTRAKDIDVRIIAVGTGQALRIARNGDADILFTHHKPSEEKFVSEGFGVRRYDVMYNDFVIVGPDNDPAKIRGCRSASKALGKIKEAKAIFVSRGDDSGTHKREKFLWKGEGVRISELEGAWYRSTGSGMGATLNTAGSMEGYAIADRGTWISFNNKQDLKILCERDPELFNPYGVILVNPEKHPHVKAGLGKIFINWLLSKEGQSAIGRFNIGGQTLFTPIGSN